MKTAEEVEKIRRKFENDELRDLAVKLSKAKADDVDDIVSELKAFAEDHPEAADKVATILHQKAGLIVKAGQTHNGEGATEAYDHADTLVAQAKDISGISDKVSSSLDSDRLGIRVGRYQAMARSPNVDSYEFWNGYSSMMWDLKSQVSDCYGGGYSAGCNGTMQAFGSAMKIPQMAKQSAYERQMFQMQMQQQMSSAFGQWGGQYSPGGNFVGMPNMMGMGMGMGMNGNPMMNMNPNPMMNMSPNPMMNMSPTNPMMPNAGFSSMAGGSPFFQ